MSGGERRGSDRIIIHSSALYDSIDIIAPASPRSSVATRERGASSPMPSPSLPQGTRVGPYEVLSQLGAGGMGEVYRAHDPRLGRDIALKVIRRVLVADETVQDEALERLLREATLASGLNHPNIVTIHETGNVGLDRYIAMEL